MFVMYPYHIRIVHISFIFTFIHTFQEALEEGFKITISPNVHACGLKNLLKDSRIYVK
jgi:hypothetical protein